MGSREITQKRASLPYEGEHVIKILSKMSAQTFMGHSDYIKFEKKLKVKKRAYDLKPTLKVKKSFLKKKSDRFL